MKLIDGQFAIVNAQILRAHAEIVSGAYKLRKVSRCTDEKDSSGRYIWVQLTEDELLKDSMRTLEAQISRLNDLVDALER